MDEVRYSPSSVYVPFWKSEFPSESVARSCPFSLKISLFVYFFTLLSQPDRIGVAYTFLSRSLIMFTIHKAYFCKLSYIMK